MLKINHTRFPSFHFCHLNSLLIRKMFCWTLIIVGPFSPWWKGIQLLHLLGEKMPEIVQWLCFPPNASGNRSGGNILSHFCLENGKLPFSLPYMANYQAFATSSKRAEGQFQRPGTKSSKKLFLCICLLRSWNGHSSHPGRWSRHSVLEQTQT